MYILNEGKSALNQNSKDLVTIATVDSNNEKTGPMWQTWILLKDIDPVSAVRNYDDVDNCGDCKHRGLPILNNGFKSRRCYVNVLYAPLAIWKSYKAGNYKAIEPDYFAKNIAKNHNVRLGSYGDPAMVPYEVFEPLTYFVKGLTGYTHQWQNNNIDNRYKQILMASTDSLVEKTLANNNDWLSFRVINSGDVYKNLNNYKFQFDEMNCPASKEWQNKFDNKTTCDNCTLCAGHFSKLDMLAKNNIVIHDHNKNSMWAWKNLINKYGHETFEPSMVNYISAKLIANKIKRETNRKLKLKKLLAA